MNDLLEIIPSGFVLLCNIILMASLVEFKYSRKVVMFSLFGTWLFVCGVAIIAHYMLGTDKAINLCLILTALPMMLVIFKLSTDSFFKNVFILFTEINIFFIIAGVCYWIIRGQDYFVVKKILINVILFAVVIFIYHKFLKKPFRKLADAIDKEWWKISLLAVAFTFVFSIAFLVPFPDILHTAQSRLLFCSLIFLMIISYLVIFNTLRYMLINYEEKVEIEQILARQNILFEQLKAQSEAIEITKHYHHDIRHHTKMILRYLYDKDITSAQKYLEEYCSQVDHGVIKQYCKNQFINAVLCLFEKDIRRENISERINVVISDEIPLEKSDIVSLFANILENAIEACKKVEGERVIILNSEMQDDILKINLENSFDGNVKFVDEIPMTTKKSSEGIGTKSVRHIVEKHNGMVNYMTENNMFITQIVIHI